MAMADLFDRITVEPGKCGGKPCIRGMRITAPRRRGGLRNLGHISGGRGIAEPKATGNE